MMIKQLIKVLAYLMLNLVQLLDLIQSSRFTVNKYRTR